MVQIQRGNRAIDCLRLPARRALRNFTAEGGELADRDGTSYGSSGHFSTRFEFVETF